MKTVAAGENYTTVEVDTAEVVKFSFASASLSVKVIEGEITVALRQGAQAEDDGTITVSEGETEMFNHYRMNVDTYYLTGSGKAVLHASNMVEVNPFEGKGKGGDAGGDNTHYKGTTTTALENGSTTNPIVIDGESYTAVFGDVVVYGYTEFVFDGTAWSEFGRPFDTTPTQGSTNAVTSDGIADLVRKGTGGMILGRSPYSTATAAYTLAFGNACNATGTRSIALGDFAAASGSYSTAIGLRVISSQTNQFSIGKYNKPRAGDLFNIGNGVNGDNRSNIVEVNGTSMNVNGDIKVNNVAIPTPYTTMPTITAGMLGKIAMYVGATDANYTQGCFYVASTDGATEPTYSWALIGGTLGLEEVVLWENDGTTNPQTITLSEAWSNFDELVVLTVGSGSVAAQFETAKHTSVMAIGSLYALWYNSDTTWGTYYATSSTVFTKVDTGGDYHIAKIIGIKY